jgi:hypothetical protein
MSRRSRVYRETTDYLEGVQRMLRALGKRVGDADIAMLPGLAEIPKVGEDLLGIAARQLHDEHGYSWTDIGTVLGISRQAARQRFARQPGVVTDQAAEGGAA